MGYRLPAQAREVPRAVAPAARVEAAGQAVPEAAVVPAAGAEPAAPAAPAGAERAVQVLPVAAQGVGPAAPAAEREAQAVEGQVLAADPVVEAVRAELAVETGRRLAAN